jgi:hypothetical protein
VLAVALVAAAGALLVASDHQQRTRFAVRFDPHKEAKFERTHARRSLPQRGRQPVAEQVADRAYPRSYVDDRLAVRSRDAFKTKPGTSAARRSRPRARSRRRWPRARARGTRSGR